MKATQPAALDRMLAGDGTGDTRWKVPGLLDWPTMRHSPFGGDTHRIEAGRLPNGDFVHAAVVIDAFARRIVGWPALVVHRRAS